MNDPDAEIDWSLTTWEGNRQAQLERTLTLTVRERLLAVEGLADIARRFQEMRAQGRFKRPAGTDTGTSTAADSEGHPAPSDRGNPTNDS